MVRQAIRITTDFQGYSDQISFDCTKVRTVDNTSFYLEKHLIEFHRSFYVCATISLPKYLCSKLSACLSIYASESLFIKPTVYVLS